MRRTTLKLAMALLLAGLAATGQAAAQSYPRRLVTMIVPSPAGSTPDLLARLLADNLRPMLGHDFIIENRPGAGGTIGAEQVARAAPDGHVLLCATEWVFFSHLLHPRLSFNPHSLEPVSVIAKYPLILLGRRDLPVNSIAELIDYARAHPGRLNYASSGKGSMHQLVYEGIKKHASIDLTHVPYRGGPPAMNDLLAGHVDVGLTSINQGAPYIREGRLKLLGIVSHARLPEFPDAPALAEVLPGLEADAWAGVAAPPGTPPAITKKLSDAIAEVLRMPSVRSRLAEMLLEPVGNTPEQMTAMVRSDAERWSPVIRAAKIAID